MRYVVSGREHKLCGISKSLFTKGENLLTLTNEARLLAAVREELSTNPYTRMQSLRVSLLNGVLILEGIVGTYYSKQMAQEAIRKILAAADPRPALRNSIEVKITS